MDREPDSFDLLKFLATFRQMLQNQNPATEAELPSNLLKYGELCEETNRRLRECHSLSLRGQYTNAVTVAEREPNLLQRCSELEIPEREILATVAQVLNIKPPALIDLGLIQSLQDAYDKGSSAASNLRMLQRLALARAPLPTRLHIMRKLLIQNPNHPFMDADIRTFERGWFKQAPDFARALAKQERPELIKEILQDFSEAGYMETPPPSMIFQVEEILAKAQRALFPTLAASIRKAYTERAIVALKALADRWNALVDEAGPPDTALRHEVAEALDWIRRELGLDRLEAERDEARARLSYLIHSRNATRSQLDLAYDAAQSRGGVDADLDRQLELKLEEMERRFKVKAVAITITAVVALFLFFIVAALTTRPSTVVATEPLGSKGGDEIARVDAGQAEAERVEAERKEAFARKMKELEESRAERDARELIDEARKLARTAEESKVLQLRIEVIERHEKLALGQKIGKILQAADDLLVDARRLRAPDPRRRDVDDLRARAAELGKESSRLISGGGDLQRLETTLVQVESWQVLAKKHATLRDVMKGARATPGTLERLAIFVADEVAPVAPDPELARRAGLARRARAIWLKAFELQALLRKGDLTPLTAASREWKESPVSAALASAAQHARTLRDRDPDAKGTTTSKLKARLAEKDIAGLWTVRPHRGDEEQIYYTSEPKKGGASINCLMRADGTKVAMPFGEGRVIERAPQSIFAEKAESLWREGPTDAWEARLAEVYDSLLGTPMMEPLLRLELARRFLDLARNTSAGLLEVIGEQPAFKEIMSLRAIGLTGNWLDPGQNKTLEKPREEAEKLIAGSPRLGPLVADAKVRGERWLEASKRGLALVGWMSRDDDGRPALAGFDGALAAPGSRLYAADDRWLELGSVSADGKEFLINETAGPFLGWPIFAIAVP